MKTEVVLDLVLLEDIIPDGATIPLVIIVTTVPRLVMIVIIRETGGIIHFSEYCLHLVLDIIIIITLEIEAVLDLTIIEDVIIQVIDMTEGLNVKQLIHLDTTLHFPTPLMIRMVLGLFSFLL